MTINFRLLIVLFSVLSFVASCSKDDDDVTAAPTISAVEVGHENNKTAYPGGDFHIEAEILAPGNVSTVQLLITPVSGSGWSFDEVFTDGLAGNKNATFHEHITIPGEAALGQYKLRLVVTDQKGQVANIESDLEIKVDPTLPAATGYEIGLNAAGNDLHLEATINAVNKIAKVIVEVHGAGWEKEFEFTDAAMVGQTTYNFHKHVNVGEAPAGLYHVHLVVVDQAGKQNEFEEHFDKK
jgi:hypothetical protein